MPRPAAPFTAQLSGNIQDQVRRIADGLSAKADATSEPTYSAVMLIAPNGSTYKVTVSNAGALVIAAVPRP